MSRNKLFKLIAIVFFIFISFNQLAFGIEYKYDNLGRLIEIIYDSGQIVEYIYDAAGNITHINTFKSKDEKQLLMIVGNPLKLTAGDKAIKEHLEDEGFTVVLSDDNSNHPMDLEEIELVYISSSINEFKIKDKYKEATKPLIIAKPNLLKYMGMTDKLWGIHYGTQILQKEINIIDSNHYISNRLEGVIEVQSESDNFGWGIPGEESTIIATTKKSNKRSTIFIYNKGDKLKDNTLAAEKRAFIFFSDNTFSKSNDNGKEIFDRIIIWLLYQ